MKFSDVELPSNRKFGFFFSGVFIIVSVYFYLEERSLTSQLFAMFATFFLLLALFKPNLLLPLNKLWMYFGLLLGMIVSPIVLGLIFFVLFFPLGIVMRMFGRDVLRIQFKKRESYWIPREPADPKSNSFKNQF